MPRPRRALALVSLLTLGCMQAPGRLNPLNEAESRVPNDPELDAADNTPPGAEPTEAGADLGRHLFYDERLSANGTVACASCHVQEFAFTDPERFSVGFDGGRTGRNSMSLVNLRFYAPERMFWDHRAADLEEQVLMPIQDPVEMGLTLDELVQTVATAEPYPVLFAQAYGDSTVTADRISDALAQFVRTLVSFDAPYDRELAVAGGDARRAFAGFSAAENLGKELFFGRAGCARCHVDGDGGGGGGGPGGPGGGPPGMGGDAGGGPLLFFTDRPANNGLDATTTDPGLADVTGNRADEGRFKSPSLRNVEVTGPYMHDGRFDTLFEVVQHYNRGVQNHPNLDNRLRDGGGPRRLGLNDAEVRALVDFLETLTDDGFLDEPAFADPF